MFRAKWEFEAIPFGIDLPKVGIPKLSADSGIDRNRLLDSRIIDLDLVELTLREVRTVLILGISLTVIPLVHS